MNPSRDIPGQDVITNLRQARNDWLNMKYLCWLAIVQGSSHFVPGSQCPHVGPIDQTEHAL